MQAQSNVIVLNDGEDVDKLDDMAGNSLKELLKYQGDSSAFDSDDQKSVLKTLPPDLSAEQLKLLEGLFPIHPKKPNLNNLQLSMSIQEGFIKTATSGMDGSGQGGRRKILKPNTRN